MRDPEIELASANALARPIPREAPVTRAVFPERELMIRVLLDGLSDSEPSLPLGPRFGSPRR
jgi:hypothetical protein